MNNKEKILKTLKNYQDEYYVDLNEGVLVAGSDEDCIEYLADLAEVPVEDVKKMVENGELVIDRVGLVNPEAKWDELYLSAITYPDNPIYNQEYEGGAHVKRRYEKYGKYEFYETFEDFKKEEIKRLKEELSGDEDEDEEVSSLLEELKEAKDWNDLPLEYEIIYI